MQLEHFSICSRNNRKGKVSFPFSYEINLNISLQNLKVNYAISNKPLFDIKSVKLSTLLKVSKIKDHTWHDREFVNDLIVDGAQIYLSPASLVFYKFVTLFQTVHSNYNFPYYKEYLVNYLEELKRRGLGDVLDTNILRSSILRNLDSRKVLHSAGV